MSTTRTWLASSLLLSLVAACHPTAHEASSDASEQEEKTAQITVWGERFEIFLEHPYLVVRRPGSFITHVTDRFTLEPRRAGPLKFVFHHGTDAPVEHIEPAPSRPGIYIPELSFAKAGQWDFALHILLEGVTHEIRLPPLTVYGSADALAEADLPEAPEGVTFLKEQQWRLQTKVERVGERSMIERLRVPGVVTARPSCLADVTPPLPGRLLPPPGHRLPSLGERVEQGQTLALVQPPLLDFVAKVADAEAEAVRTKLALDAAKQALARTTELAAKKAKSERELQEAQFAHSTAKANHDAAVGLKAVYRKVGALLTTPPGEEDLDEPDLPALVLEAPISGHVIKVDAAVGAHISADRAIFRILDNEFVYIEAKIPESDLHRIASGRRGTYEIPADRGRFVSLLAKGTGRVVFFGTVVEPSTRTVPLVYEVENSGGHLRIGMALNLYLETARSERTVAVPDSAIVEEDGRPIAFVQLSGETFEKRHLSLGIRDSGFVQVLAGLSPDEWVVTKEAYAVRLASVSTAIPAHGHTH